MDSNPSKSVISSPEIVRVPCRVSHESRDAINETSSADDSMLVVEAEHTDASATVTEHIAYPTKLKHQTITLVQTALIILSPRLRIPDLLKTYMLFIRTMSFLAQSEVWLFFSPTRLMHDGDYSAIKENRFALTQPPRALSQSELAGYVLSKPELAGLIALENNCDKR